MKSNPVRIPVITHTDAFFYHEDRPVYTVSMDTSSWDSAYDSKSDSENSNSSLDIVTPPEQSDPGELTPPNLTPPLTVKCKWRDCGLMFGHLDGLAAHVTSLHANSGPGGLFFCGWEGCGRGNRGFNARYKMLVHVRTHTNEKPHHCYQCDKSFSRAENLKIHARSHTGERPYLCPVPGCGKAYSNSSDRFKHTRTHFVDKPYVCKVAGCGKRYTDPSSLRKHVKTYRHSSPHGEDAAPKETVFKMDEDMDHEQIVPESEAMLHCGAVAEAEPPGRQPSPAGEGVSDVRYELFRNWFSQDGHWEWSRPADCRHRDPQDAPLDLSVRK